MLLGGALEALGAEVDVFLARVRVGAGTSVEPLVREEIPGVLAERFGLEGFALDGAGRITLADAPSATPAA
jgi:hypothetical protein